MRRSSRLADVRSEPSSKKLLAVRHNLDSIFAALGSERYSGLLRSQDLAEPATARGKLPPSTVIDQGFSVLLAVLLREHFEISSIVALTQLPSKHEKAFAVDIAHSVGDLLDTGDLEPLAHLNRAHELGRFEQ